MCFPSFVSMTKAQMMARGEGNIESCLDESSSSEDVPSRVEGNGVITWLKPVRETRVDSFW